MRSMLTTLCVFGVVAGVLAPPVRGEIFTAIPAIAGQADTPDGSSWTLMTVSGPFASVNAAWFSFGLERRGVLEYSLEGLPANAEILSASLRVNVSSSTSVPANLLFTAYAGDGALELSDVFVALNAAGQSGDFTGLPVLTVPLNPASLDQVIAQQTGYLGLVALQNNLSANSSFRVDGNQALLTIEFVPPDCNGNGVFDDEDISTTLDIPGPVTSFGAPVNTRFAIADLNGDDIPDVALTTIANELVIRYGDGAGSFVGGASVPLSDRPGDVAAADLDGDGDQDLAAILPPDTLVLLRNTNGQFAVQGIISPGEALLQVRIADVNFDNLPDLVQLSQQGVTIYRNDGNLLLGSFTTFGPYPIAAGVREFIVAPLNNDLFLDVATLHDNTAGVDVMLTSNSTALGTPTRYAVGSQPRGLAFAQVNGDSSFDLLATSRGNNEVRVLLNDGNGGFASSTTVATGTQPEQIAMLDVVGDSAPDLITMLRNTGKLAVHENLSGAFGTPEFLAAGRFPTNAVVSDIDGDSHADLVLTDVSGSVIAYLNDPPNGLPAGPDFLNVATAGPAALIARDFDGDGDLDVAAALYGPDGVAILRNDAGVLNVAGIFPAGVNGFQIASADFNGDTLPDIVCSAVASGNINILLNLGGLNFSSPAQFSVPSDATGVTTIDYDHDGHIDIAAVAAGDYNQGCMCFSAGNLFLFHNDGAGNFTPDGVRPLLDGASDIVASDLNGDGWDDLAITHITSLPVRIFFSDGAGDFAPPVDLPLLANRVYSIEAVDMNNDGIRDLLLGRYDVTQSVEYDTIEILANDGLGNFTPLAAAPGVGAIRARSVDLDGDGDLDVVGACGPIAALTVFENTGGGQLSPPRYRVSAPETLGLLPIDLDPNTPGSEILVGDLRGTVAIHANLTTPTTSRDCNDNTIPDECELADGSAHDVNGDGQLDECQPAPCGVDLNGNGIVELGDLASMFGAWGTPGGDVNGDMNTDLGDLALLFSLWGGRCH